MKFAYLVNEDIGGVVQPPPLEQFKERVRSAPFVDSLRKLRDEVVAKARWDNAWLPHLTFVEEFMHERDISF